MKRAHTGNGGGVRSSRSSASTDSAAVRSPSEIDPVSDLKSATWSRRSRVGWACTMPDR